MRYTKLTVGAYGSDVNRLHILLRERGLEIPQSEVKQGFFGPATRRAVIAFQAGAGVEKTGHADEKLLAILGSVPAASSTSAVAGLAPVAAATLGASTATRGAGVARSLDSASEFVVHRIASPLKFGDYGDAVRNLQGALLLLMRGKVFQPADDLRRFLDDVLPKERAEHAYKDATTQAVAIFQEQYQLRVEQPGAVDAPTAEALNEQLEKIGAFDQTSANWVVRGCVVDTKGPLNGVLVTVFDRDLFDGRDAPNTRQRLGAETTKRNPATNEDGWFEIIYTSANFTSADVAKEGNLTPDLLFTLSRDGQLLQDFEIYRLPDGNDLAEETLVSEDDLIVGIQSRRLEEVRIGLPGGERNPPMSEYERLWRAIEPLLADRASQYLDAARRESLVGAAAMRFDEEKHRDISFVTRELDEPRDKIDALVVAFRLHRGVFHGAVPAAILYAVARSKLRAMDVARLALATSGQLETAILQAIALGIIPAQTGEVIEDAIRAIRDMSALHALAEAPAGGGAPYADVLRSALPDEAQRVTLLQAAAGREADAPAMWAALRAHPAFAGDGAVDRAQFALQLDAVTAGHLPLMEALQHDHGITSMRDLVALDAAQLRATIDRPGIGVPEGMPGDSDGARADAYVTGLMGQLQVAFPTEITAKVLERAPLGAIGDEALQRGVLATLSRSTSEAMRAAGTAFDIGTTQIDSYLAEHGERVLAYVAADARSSVVSTLKRTQRLFRVSTSPDSLDWMLRNDYHSAFQIAEVPRQTFIREASAMLGEPQARMLHSRAVAIGDATLMSYVQMHDAVAGIHPAAVYAGEDRIEAKKAAQAAVAKHMPSWQALFNEDALCACTHCRSVYSPAAYLVDLLHFLDLSTKTTAGKAPLDLLLARRPDLADLELTCENTNTEIPYVDLVNEVLESLVVSLDTSKIPSFDTAGATAGELWAAPQHTNWDAYVTPSVPGTRARLDRAVYPRSLPFDAPLGEARTYLNHLGVSRAELMLAFADGPLTNALAAERLGISPNAFEVIAGETLDGANGDLGASLDDRYGWAETPPVLIPGISGPFVWTLKRKLIATGAELTVGDDPATESFDAAVRAAVEAFQTDRALPVTGSVDPNTWALLVSVGPPFVSAVLSHVPTFLVRSGLSFQEVVAILRTRFINPEVRTFEVVRSLRLPDPELLAFVQGAFEDPAELAGALEDAHVAEAEFALWAKAHFDGAAGARLRQTLLVDGPTDAGCTLEVLFVRHWDGAARTPTDAEWIKLDRFIRLWRALGWSIEELDLALSSLGATDVTGSVMRQLAQIGELARLLELSVTQVVALWADPDPTRPESLYTQRFGSRALLRLDPAFQPDWAGNVLASATVGEHLSALQAGLRATGPDLVALRAHLGLTDDGAALTLEGVGSLLRSVTLARALQVNVRDLVLLLDLTGLQPFVAPTDDWAALRFAVEVQRIRQSGLNPKQLALILSDVATPEPSVARDRLLEQLQEGLRAIATEFDPAGETDGSLTRRSLALLGVAQPLVDSVMAILLGTDRSTVDLPAPAKPAPTIPADWSQRLVYGASSLSPSLSCLGALTDAERKTVAEFSADAGYRAAVTRLHAAPRAIIKDLAAALSELGVAQPTAADLLTKTLFVADSAVREKLARDRLLVLLEAILPPLRDRLGRTLIKQTLALVQPDAATLALLLEGKTTGGRALLPASDPTQPLIKDFLGLVEGADMTAAAQDYELLVRLRRLTESLTLGADDIRTLLRHVVKLRATVGHLCTYDDWTKIAAYARVRGRTGQPAGVLATLWEAASPESARASLVSVLGWSDATIAGLMDPAGLALGLLDVQQLAPLERLIAAGELVVKLGISVEQAVQWARSPIGQAATDEARRAVKAKYDEPAWLEVAGTLSDPLRDARRAALVAYLVPRLGVTDANALYQRLLIDVEMSPCMTTSRIKQAISSTQLFVQRCLLNLEPDVTPEAIDDEHWTWMKNYRVWEANRKVLLYPENWILPELRDDKTPFFRELESDLLQNDVSDPNVEHAFETYLEKLDTVAKLEIVAMHVQEDFEPDEKLRTVVHIFGCTANPPQARYYRRYVVTHNGTGLWTPWEPMPVDIQGKLLAPVTFNRRLYLFWAAVTTKAKESKNKKDGAAEMVQEIGLAWSEYRHGAWSPTRVTEAGQILVADVGRVERLQARVEGDDLRLLCITNRQFVSGDDKKKTMSLSTLDSADANMAITTSSVGTFLLGGCRSKVLSDGDDVMTHATGFAMQLRTSTFQGGHSESGRLEIKPLSGKLPAPLTAIVLGDIADRSRLVESTWVLGDGGYFVFEDEQRSFLAQVSDARVPPHASLVVPNKSYPRRLSTEASGPAFATNSTDNRLVAGIMQAEASGHPWATASASLASAGKASLFASAGAIVRVDRDEPTLQDSATKDALTGAVLAERLAVGRSDLSIRFEPLFHPFVCTYIKALRQSGVRGLLTPGNQQLRLVPGFAARYEADKSVARAPYPTSLVDFGATEKPGIYRSTAYSVYNWELFFHLPMLIADRLMQNRRFEDARRWLHYVFNPTDGTGAYWQFLPFQTTPLQSLEDWLRQLSAGDPDLKQQIAEWKDHPFEPHRIARMRLPAYKKYAVMKYLDNLIAWGDDLFKRDTMEFINSATQLYVMAADLLGPRPELIPSRGETAAMTFAEMRGKLDALSNAVAESENAAPFLSGATMAPAAGTVGLLGVGRSLYFCLPPNDKLLAYWDTVDDRLFKVRNCMNLAGVVRKLPLFEPQIDPALLVAAAAQGLDLDSVLGDLGAPMPLHRFRLMFQRALEACSDVRAFGAMLLSTLEKKDAEELALLRASQEATLRRSLRESRKQQELEALEQVKVLENARAAPVERLLHFRGLMGLDTPVPGRGTNVPFVLYDPKPSAEGGVFLIEEESQELDESHSARDKQIDAGWTEVLASLSHYIPTLEWKVGIYSVAFGGVHVGPGLTALSRHQALLGSERSYNASHAAKMATYKRRHQDYAHQANLAACDIMHIDKQITAAGIHAEVARLEREHLETEIAQSELVEQHLRSKYTNVDLFGWMQGQIASLYFQSFQLAKDLAKSAERCFRFERGLTSSNIIGPGGWDDLHRGLLAGETLQLRLRQLERAHQEQDRRELEITKHVSLLELAPLALLRLKETGRCEVELSEVLYDMDYPGHYMRRIRSVSVTIPAVTGPYTSLNATLTMLTNETRIKPELRNGKFERDVENDDGRFATDFTPIRAIVTSTGQNDHGLFEPGVNDERYLPFEGAGAAGRWLIEIDRDCNRFDLDTIADVVLHIRYTARDGGKLLAQKSKEHWRMLVADAESSPQARLFSLRQDFPNEWHRLRTVAQASGDHVQTIPITQDRFPFLFAKRELHVGRIDMYGLPTSGKRPTKLPALRQPDDELVALTDGAPLGALLHRTAAVDVTIKGEVGVEGNQTASMWQLSALSADVAASIAQLDDIVLVCHYDVRPVAS